MILRAALLVIGLAGAAHAQTIAFDLGSPILIQHCIRCHSGPSAPMGLDLTSHAPGDPVLWPDVQPIFDRACIKCHSDNSKLAAPPEGLRLTALEQVLVGGERLVIVPGNPQMSPLLRHVTGTALPRMPADGPPWLDLDDIRLITDWITQDAPDAAGTPAAIPTGANLRLRGVLTGPTAIDGADFTIGPNTRIDDRPAIGDPAEMRGVVQADGTVLATRFRDR